MDETQRLLDSTSTGEDNPTLATEIKKTSDKVEDVHATAKDVASGIEDIKSTLSDMSKTADDVANEKQKQAGDQISNDNSVNFAGGQHIQHHYYGHGYSGVKEVSTNGTSIDKEAKTYDLTKPDDFASFGERYKASEHFAFAIILSVFEHVELDDLHALKTSLILELPKITDDKDKEIGIKQDSYFAINNLVRIVNGKFYETDAGEKCVGLGEMRKEALKNL